MGDGSLHDEQHKCLPSSRWELRRRWICSKTSLVKSGCPVHNSASWYIYWWFSNDKLQLTEEKFNVGSTCFLYFTRDTTKTSFWRHTSKPTRNSPGKMRYKGVYLILHRIEDKNRGCTVREKLQSRSHRSSHWINRKTQQRQLPVIAIHKRKEKEILLSLPLL